MNITEIIIRHLQTNRRLVVPSLGAFVAKDSGEIVFSQLLSTDDGVLTGLLAAEGMSELECAMVIDRFVFDVGHSVSRNGFYHAEGLGYLVPDRNGSLRLEHSAPSQAEAGENPAAAAETQPAMVSFSDYDIKSRAKAVRERQQRLENEAKAAATSAGSSSGQEPAAGAEEAKSEQVRPADDSDAVPAGNPTRGARRTSGRKADRFILLAIAVAVAIIAFAAIAYGYYVSRLDMEQSDDEMMDQLRIEIGGADAGSDADAVQGPDAAK